MRGTFRLVFPGASVTAVAVFLASIGGCQRKSAEEVSPTREDAALQAWQSQPQPSGSETPQEPDPPRSPLDEARALMAEGYWNDVLNLMDDYLPDHPQDFDARMIYGEANLAFAQAEIERSRTDGATIQGLYLDAENAFQIATELRAESVPAYLGLVRARQALGRSESAWEAARAGMQHVSEPASHPEWLETFGRAGLDWTIARIQAGESPPAAARQSESWLRTAVQSGRGSANLPLADLLAWQGQNQPARDVLVQALNAKPDDLQLIGRLKNLASGRDLVADLELARDQAAEDATLLWFLGEAHYNSHLAMRQSGDFTVAYEALDRSEESFLRARQQREDFAASCAAWLHLVRTARGWTLREEGRIEDAGGAFLAALEADPARLEADPTPGTLTLGIYAIVDDHMRRGRMDRVRGFLTRVTALHRDNPDWQNNLAFVCRELGVAAQSREEMEEAQGLWRQSWEAYTRCVELSPEDARLVNDRALIAVYYLEESYFELAESELHRSIAVGVPQLEALPENVTQEERQNLEEAIGDAWENLAYLDVMRRQRTDRATEYLANSERYYPYERRVGVQRIRQEQQRLEAQNPDAESEGS